MKEDKALIYTALMGWKKHIETGNFAGMDKDTMLYLAHSDRDMQKVVSQLPKLDYAQQDFCKRLEDLATKVLNTY